MKHLYYLLVFCFFSFAAYPQCTPVNCLNQLPPYGGLCNTSLINGRVNQPYYDSISFHITDVCVDAGTLDPQYAGLYGKVIKLHTFSYSGFPAGLTGATNQTEYFSPANGCGGISGIPTEAGVFDATIHILANYRTWSWPFTSCNSSLIYLDYNDQPFDGSLSFTIYPDPSFTGLDSTYCFQDSPVALIITGTPGGTFSGQGVSGNTFDPSLAGPGVHVITYTVTAQQGAAVGPSIDSSTFTVTVTSGNQYFADTDGDGFGNPDSIVIACSIMPGVSADSTDCNDNDAAINPNTIWFADMDGDGYTSVLDSIIGCFQPNNYILATSSLGPDCDDNDSLVGTVTVYYEDADNDSYGNPNVSVSSCVLLTGYVTNNLDCNDTNFAINPDAVDIPYNGIDEDCSGSDSTNAGIHEFFESKFRIFPNPAKDFFYIESIDPASTNGSKVIIETVLGQKIVEHKLNAALTRIDIDPLYPDGLYFIHIIDRNNSIIHKQKIILQ